MIINSNITNGGCVGSPITTVGSFNRDTYVLPIVHSTLRCYNF